MAGLLSEALSCLLSFRTETLHATSTMNSLGSGKTLPHRIYHDPVTGWFLWDVEVDGKVIGGQACSFNASLQELNLVISAAGFPLVEYHKKQHTTTTPHVLHKPSRVIAFLRFAVLPGLLFSLALITIINLLVLFGFPFFFHWTLLSPIPFFMAIVIIASMDSLREWNDNWRPRTTDYFSLPWPWGETRPEGDPTKAPPLPLLGKNFLVPDDYETAVFQFLTAARRIHYEGNTESHPLLEALRKLAIEKRAKTPTHFVSPTTSLPQSVDEWMTDRLRNLRYSARFVREAFDADLSRSAKPRCSIDYIESASDFSKESDRLLRLRDWTEDFAFWLAVASWVIVPAATYCCWTYQWELGLPPRFYLSVMLAFPALVLVLRAKMRRTIAKFKDFRVQRTEARLLSPVAEVKDWDSWKLL